MSISPVQSPSMHANEVLRNKNGNRAKEQSAIENSDAVDCSAWLPEDEHYAFVKSCAEAGDRDGAARRMHSLTETLIELTGKGLQLAERDLSSLNLRGFNFQRANLNRAALFGANLSDANLSEASLICSGTERTNFTAASLAGAYLHAFAAQVCDFTHADLSGITDATGSLFHGCKLRGANLNSSVLSGASFYQCDLTACTLEAAHLQGATINECILDEASFRNSECSQLTITKCHADRLSLSQAVGEELTLQRLTSAEGLVLAGAQLPRLRVSSVDAPGLIAESLFAVDSTFDDCRFPKSDFRRADLRRSTWRTVGLRNATFANAKLIEASLRRVCADDSSFAQVSAENISVVESSFKNADMKNFAARTATFRDCCLASADLESAYLYRAMLTGDPPTAMSLRGARLENANLVQAYLAADLRDTNLRGARLAYARLNQSVFDKGDLRGCGMYQASMVKTSFTRCSMQGVTGPFFADRCPGLLDSLKDNNSDPVPLADLTNSLQSLLRSFQGGST